MVSLPQPLQMKATGDMNERIRELTFKAGAKLHSEPPMRQVTGVYMSFESVEKLTELIVRECADIAVNADSGGFYTADAAGYVSLGRQTASKLIKEHFGVK